MSKLGATGSDNGLSPDRRWKILHFIIIFLILVDYMLFIEYLINNVTYFLYISYSLYTCFVVT